MKKYVFMQEYHYGAFSIPKYSDLTPSTSRKGTWVVRDKDKGIIASFSTQELTKLLKESIIAQTEDVTPTWEAVLPIYLSAFPITKSALGELQNMARAADKYNALVKKLKDAGINPDEL